MNDDSSVVETRLLRAFADSPDPIALAARDARVMTTVRSARTRPMPPAAPASNRAWMGAAAALALVVVGAGAWWSLGSGSGHVQLGIGVPASATPAATLSATPPAIASPSPGVSATATDDPGPIAEAQADLDRGRARITDDPAEALRWCRAAWQQVQHAETDGVDEAILSPVRADVIGCLDTLYAVRTMPEPSRIALPATTPRPGSLVEGPDRRAYLIDGASGAVIRVNVGDGTTERIVRPGDGGVGRPRLLASAGADLVILDDAGAFWRWRRPTVELRRLPAPRTPSVNDAVAMEASLVDADRNQYTLSVVGPSAGQIVRYNPAEGAGFSDAAAYLAEGGLEVAAIRDLLVDTDLYALTADTLVRYVGGRLQDFRLATPPDDLDLRPGHDYRFVEARDDRFFVYDARWGRILVFHRASGDYLEQWPIDGAGPGGTEVLGLELLTPGQDGEPSPPTLMWVTRSGLFTSTLDGGAAGTEASPPAE